MRWGYPGLCGLCGLYANLHSLGLTTSRIHRRGLGVISNWLGIWCRGLCNVRLVLLHWRLRHGNFWLFLDFLVEKVRNGYESVKNVSMIKQRGLSALTRINNEVLSHADRKNKFMLRSAEVAFNPFNAFNTCFQSHLKNVALSVDKLDV